MKEFNGFLGLVKGVDETQEDLNVTMREIEKSIEKNKKDLTSLENEIQELSQRVRSQMEARKKGLKVNNDEELLDSIKERADELRKYIAADNEALTDAHLLVDKYRKGIFSGESNKERPLN